jgi:uncharacterized protein
MKCVLCITQKCNLDCEYCYIGKKPVSMPSDVARSAVDFIFERTSPEDFLDIGFFGGEPLLELESMKTITGMIKSHPKYDACNVSLSLVTNGTIFSDEIAEFVNEHGIQFGISCDGPPAVQDRFRHFSDGRGSSNVVEETISKAVEAFPTVLVNAVYTPSTLSLLPDSVEYFSSLGVRRIFLSPDYSASWTESHIDSLENVYRDIAEKYIEYYHRENPHFISIIDNKIAVILRGGYQPSERCSMGRGELAFAPSGNIYPCERLIGADDGSVHSIGNIGTGIDPGRMACQSKAGAEVNTECTECGIRDYCMNWCGCSNYFSSGYYNRVDTFLCRSEQAAVKVAFDVFQRLEEEIGGLFMEHVSGKPFIPALVR